MEREKEKILLFSILIHAMMQQFSVAEDINCSQISCSNYCKTLKFPSLNLDFNEQHRNQLDSCCRVLCDDYCYTNDDVKEHNDEWKDESDPCITNYCDNGDIRNFSSLCRPLLCPSELQTTPPGECCPTCDASWASFCPGHEECDFACQFGYQKDEERHCDLCKCSRATTSMASSTITSGTFMNTTEKNLSGEEMSAESTEENVQTIEINFPSSSDVESSSANGRDGDDVQVENFWPPDDVTQWIIIALFSVFSVILFACILGAIVCCLRRRVYKPVPLLNSSSRGSNA